MRFMTVPNVANAVAGCGLMLRWLESLPGNAPIPQDHHPAGCDDANERIPVFAA